jgi:hypothetical protein
MQLPKTIGRCKDWRSCNEEEKSFLPLWAVVMLLWVVMVIPVVGGFGDVSGSKDGTNADEGDGVNDGAGMIIVSLFD